MNQQATSMDALTDSTSEETFEVTSTRNVNEKISQPTDVENSQSTFVEISQPTVDGEPTSKEKCEILTNEDKPILTNEDKPILTNEDKPLKNEDKPILTNEDKPLKKVTLTSKLAMNDKVLTQIKVTSKVAAPKVDEEADYSSKWDNYEKKDYFGKWETQDNLSEWDVTYDFNENVMAMPSVIGFITMSFYDRQPYEFTITTMTHYISGKCDPANKWLHNLDNYIQRLNISILYVAGTIQKQILSHYVSSAKMEFSYSKFKVPAKQKCPGCFRHGCSKFKAANILRYNFCFNFSIPCSY